MDLVKLGIRQRGDPVLNVVASPFRFPEEAGLAKAAWEKLVEMSKVLKAQYSFSKGVGLAGPQVGLSRCIALVQLPGADAKCIINPKIVEQSSRVDSKYEGCLSCFDYRAMVRRPLEIIVEYQDIAGARHLETFKEGAARLVAHEIDHMQGVLCVDRVTRSEDVITYDTYVASGDTEWKY